MESKCSTDNVPQAVGREGGKQASGLELSGAANLLHRILELRLRLLQRLIV
jgi:hypothetical protein